MDFNKKYFGIPLALIITLTVVGIASAAIIVYETSIRGRVKIEPVPTGDNYGITIYGDAECTNELDFIDFGSIRPGEASESDYFYIKNTGDTYIPNIRVYQVLITAQGWETPGYFPSTLDVGEVKRFYVRVTAEPDAAPGEYEGEIPIVCYGSES